jgi:endoglucanase
MKIRSIAFLFLIPMVFLTAANGSASATKEFIHAKGRKLVVGTDDAEIVLHGVNFGNDVWDNPAAPPTTHHNGTDYARLKTWGANAVRFLMNYQLFEDDANPYAYKQTGWEWLDRNVAWAKGNGIYLILNMHIPQGGFQSLGQGNALWDNPENRARFMALWKAIAARYRNEPAVAGYELLNEPNTSQSKDQWVNLAADLVRDIRSVDSNHLIIVERLNAISSTWTDPALDPGFFPMEDRNIMYTFHFYDPFEYTSQLTSWTYLSDLDGGRYPDPSKIYVPSDIAWAGGVYDNPRAPSGSFDWKYLSGVRFQVTDPSVIAGKPVLFSENNSGTVLFDDFTIEEYDENREFLKTILSIDAESASGWSFWSDKGSVSFGLSDTEGHNDSHSLSMTGSTARAGAASYLYFFETIPGHYYSVSGWMKGIKAAGSSYFGIDFVKSPSGGKAMRRNKEFLSHSLSHYLEWGISNNVPLYCGEFGCYFECYANNKGGTDWLRDTVDLLKQSGVSYTFFDYHEPSFGIFPNKGLPDESAERRGIADVLIDAWQ